ncbi:MAG: hypothetical protein BWX55_00043 [Deltaproteobacteria bacterium ADurb.Bin022]|nr:MAG: hypothetical protein BWX55_00043 [Deltaproteobacteria bacterium ADurb.Bin022]
MKRTALTRDTFHPEAPPHQFRQSSGNRQAQAGSAVFSRHGGVGLLKTLKNHVQLFRWNADAGVLDGNVHAAEIVFPASGRDFFGHQDHLHAALLRKFNGVADQIRQNLLHAGRIADDGIAVFRRRPAGKPDLLFLDPDGHHSTDVANHLPQAERNRFQRQLSGFDFGQIQNRIDDIEKIFPRRLEDPNVFGLLFIERAFLQHFRHADDGVHRRPDFMAHAGQKFRLRLAGLLGLFGQPAGQNSLPLYRFVHPAQFLFHLFSVRNVENKPVQIQQGPVITGDTATLLIDPALASVPVQDPVFDFPGVTQPDRFSNGLFHSAGVVPVNNAFKGANGIADKVGCRITCHPIDVRTHVDHRPVFVVHAPVRDAGDIRHQGSELLLALGQRLFRRFALGNLPDQLLIGV